MIVIPIALPFAVAIVFGMFALLSKLETGSWRWWQ